MVWYQVRRYGGAGCIVVLVLLLHLLFLITWTLYKPMMRSMQQELGEKYTLVSLAPEPVTPPIQPVMPKPEPQIPAEREVADEKQFASLMPQQQAALQEKLKDKEALKREPSYAEASDFALRATTDRTEGRQREENSDADSSTESKKDELLSAVAKKDALDNAPTTLVKEKQEPIKPEPNPQKETPTSEKNKPETIITPPSNVVLDDDLPIPFLGVNTNQISDKDSEFHRFIKLVNKALYASMQIVPQPISSLPRPIAVRMVIVRTGRLAQTPTVIHSSGDPIRDQWYITMIERASASFPPIPMSLRIPFIELAFREGMDRASPYR